MKKVNRQNGVGPQETKSSRLPMDKPRLKCLYVARQPLFLLFEFPNLQWINMIYRKKSAGPVVSSDERRAEELRTNLLSTDLQLLVVFLESICVEFHLVLLSKRCPGRLFSVPRRSKETIVLHARCRASSRPGPPCLDPPCLVHPRLISPSTAVPPCPAVRHPACGMYVRVLGSTDSFCFKTGDRKWSCVAQPRKVTVLRFIDPWSLRMKKPLYFSFVAFRNKDCIEESLYFQRVFLHVSSTILFATFDEDLSHLLKTSASAIYVFVGRTILQSSSVLSANREEREPQVFSLQLVRIFDFRSRRSMRRPHRR